MANQQLLQSIATTLADYRHAKITVSHVDEWVQQFDADTHDDVLVEMDHLLKQLYMSRAELTSWLRMLAGTAKVAGTEPATFWREARLLRLQPPTKSQGYMSDEFESVVAGAYGIDVGSADTSNANFTYLDDGLFSGTTMRRELTAWIKSDAPGKARLRAIVPVAHAYGHYIVDKAVTEAARDSGKSIDFAVMCSVTLEDRKRFFDSAQVLRPTSLGSDPSVHQWVSANLTGRYTPLLRKAGSSPASPLKPIFFSPATRDVLEQQFLKAGVRIINSCTTLKKKLWPLGFTHLSTLGFGTLFATWRNCPNNAPLALWWGTNGWHPLMPRDTSTAVRRDSWSVVEQRVPRAPSSGATVSLAAAFEDQTEHDDSEYEWERQARKAVEALLTQLEFDRANGVVRVPTEHGSITFDNRDGLEAHLYDAFNEAWYGYTPSDPEGDFASDPWTVTEMLDDYSTELAEIGWE